MAAIRANISRICMNLNQKGSLWNVTEVIGTEDSRPLV